MRRPPRPTLAWLVALLSGCSSATKLQPQPGEEHPGGATTSLDSSQAAYSQPASNLTQTQTSTFQAGNLFNGADWIVAPASLSQRDGLGPLYNAVSCSSCHLRDGRGRPAAPHENMLSVLVRLSVPGEDEHGGPKPEPHYGGQLQPHGVPGVPAEAVPEVVWQEEPGTYADGTRYSLRRPTLKLSKLGYGPMQPDTMFSLRMAPQQYGLGLLEAVTEEDLTMLADPDDADKDGISGRINHVWDPVHKTKAIGRFGWKANVPSVEAQTAGAMSGDLGITTSIFPDSNCAPGQTACAASPNGGEPEASDDFFNALVFYGQTLAVPARSDYRSHNVLKGQAQFRAAGCDGCHVPSFTTGKHPIDALSDQLIWPYTDLLLHDMGPDLADHRPDFEASGTEWRTPPLWGINLLQTVNGYAFFLHDGRARDLAEAILWHGGEAESAREAFRSMSRAERDALLAFLGSL